MSYVRTNPARTNPVRTNPSHPQRLAPIAPNRSHNPEDELGSPTRPDPQERTVEHRGAYSVKPPDATKRDKIQRVADAEAKSFDRYKQQQRQPQYVTTNAAVGAVTTRREVNDFASNYSHFQPSLASVTSQSRGTRSGVSSIQASSGAIPKKKPVSLKTQTARMEDPEIERRKSAQRQKAEALQVKQSNRQKQLQQDMRSKNNAFLDRLEAQKY